MPTALSDTILTDTEFKMVRTAFHSLNPDASGLVTLDAICFRFHATEHPRVKKGFMAPSAARDTLLHHFGICAAEHGGGVAFDEFLAYHNKLVDEALDEQVGDKEKFIQDTIMGIWRLGDLLLPTGISPAFPLTEMPRGLYATTLMTLLWVEKDPDRKGVHVLKGIKDVVRPIFARGDLPAELQGHFAYPIELVGLDVQYLPTIISIQRWLDFVWEYDEGKYCGVQGIISARVDLNLLPPSLLQFVVEHDVATKQLCCKQFVHTAISSNPMYKRSSEAYGVGVIEECRKVHAWKAKSLLGKQYGLQYQGLRSGYFASMSGPTQSNTATGINL